MDATTVFVETFARMPDLVSAAVHGLTDEQLAHRVDSEANSIAWLVWHLSRVQDDHLAGAAHALGWSHLTDEVWTSGEFADRFALPFGDAIGYGQSPEDVAKVRVGADLLLAYYAAVAEQTTDFLAAVSPGDWESVVDERWDPPVTLLTRVASVLGDVTQHVGQAAYVRGLVERAG